MKLTLTGTYEQTTYKWSQEFETHHTHGTVLVPIKVTLTTADNTAKFNFHKYDAFNYDQDPNTALVKHIGQFKGLDMEPAYRQWKDNSGGTWEGLTWVGEYITYESKCCEFHISRHISTDFVDVHALWPHKRYPTSKYKEMKYESTIFGLDARSKQALENLFAQHRA